MSLSYVRRPRLASRDTASSQHPCLAAFDQELDYLFATLRRLGAGAADVEDLAHEVFIVLHDKWPTIDTTRPLRPYLFGVAFRVCSAHRRKWRREIPSEAFDLADDAATPEAAMERTEATSVLMAALDRVSLSRRAVVVMHDLEGMSALDIARALSMSRFGVYARLRKGRLELRAAIRRLLSRRPASPPEANQPDCPPCRSSAGQSA